MTAPATTAQTPAECVLAAVEEDPQPAAAALGLTPQQALNLARLARYLRRVYPAGRAATFNMGVFYSEDRGLVRAELLKQLKEATGTQRVALINQLQPNECGTVACAIGHGPAAGLRVRRDEDWMTYAHRCFLAPDNRGYAALFSGDWAYRDNTARGAAARICYALQHGWGELTQAPRVGLYEEYMA